MSITSAPANGARDASAARVTRHWVVCLLPSHTPRSLSSYRRVCACGLLVTVSTPPTWRSGSPAVLKCVSHRMEIPTSTPTSLATRADAHAHLGTVLRVHQV